jgi:inorganic pyrophosphatase
MSLQHPIFSVYKGMEGKRTEVLGWKDGETAQDSIQASHQRYLQSNAS